MKKCPKCKAKIEEENRLFVQQKYSTEVQGCLDKNGEFDGDISSGYCLLDEFIEAMLSEEGKPEVYGCESCQ